MYIVAFAALIIMAMYKLLVTRRRQAGIRGWVKSQDLDGRGNRVYRNYQSGISAKPDVVEGGRVIEEKSAEVKDKARRSDILQVAAEMVATGLEEAELRYGNNKRFQFHKNSLLIQETVKEVKKITERMNWHLRRHITPKGTPSRKKCAKCSFHGECSDGNYVS